MKDIVENYIKAIISKFSHIETSEMGYRTDFEILLKGVFESMKVSRFDNDPKAKGGNKPDFVAVKDDVPLLYIETKDIGISLDKVEASEQMSRYFGYENLVLTDYLEFRFYRNGLSYGEPIKIAGYDIKSRTITTKPESYEYLARTLLDFTKSHKESIRSGQHLAKIMGGKGQRIRDNIKVILSTEEGKGSELMNVFETIKRLLVHDLTVDSFADMYAQTLVYGLFVARFYDDSLDSFNRQEARDLIPASNPFLGHFFDHIAGRNFEKRLSYIVDELCEVFTHADVAKLMKQHFEINSKKGKQRGQDQVIHFYEDFLKEYDDALRKKMGAYYTPLPVVQFIVRSVDLLLEKEFKLVDGLASTTKTKDNIHKVQILDPAVGTGTFISDIIGKIYKRVKKGGQEGRWPGYVHYNLLPRLHGFELMMAPYTIAHLKLSMALKETGFLKFYETSTGKARLGIYLTNSLEEVSNQPELLAFDFGASIAEEAKEASKIKNERPIMVVVGNPPYSVSSSNKGEWIQNLIKVYKQNLNEKKINLDDDYIKFIRFAEHFIEKNGSGIVAMITNNSFIGGITHRQMRKHLLETFDDIYILDLHGNTKKKEVTPEGGKDENVFDIQQGVSINIFVRKVEVKKGLGRVYHADLYGKRIDKFENLNNNSINSIKWQKLEYTEPYYFFVPKNLKLQEEYNTCFKLDELMPVYNSGVSTDRDPLFLDFSDKALTDRIQKLLSGDFDPDFKSNFRVEDSSSYNLTQKIKGKFFDEKHIQRILYRIFDFRYIYYDHLLVSRPAYKVMQHFLNNPNVGLIFKRQAKDEGEYTNFFVSKSLIINGLFAIDPLGREVMAPLYLYGGDGSKTANLKRKIVDEIEEVVGKTTPEDIFDYIYAVLHAPSYRDKYKEFLKIDFPRVPYPKSKDTYNKLVKLGSELRTIHLLESPKVNKFITTYSITGNDIVDKKPEYKDGKVFINDSQYFGNVPKIAWDFYIGGYQPIQKWLKDRKDRELTSEDIEHYQKMIIALVETDKIMKEINKIDF